MMLEWTLLLGLAVQAGTASSDVGVAEIVQGSYELELSEALEELELAKAAKEEGDCERALAHLVRARALSEELPFSEPSGEVENLLLDIGYTAYRCEEVELAEQVWGRYVEEAEAVYDADDTLLLDTKLNLAAACSFLGELERASSLNEEVLGVKERTLHADHPDIQFVRSNLAVVQTQQGDHRAALELRTAVLEVYERTLPSDDLKTLDSRSAVAESLDGLFCHDAALQHRRAILEAAERTLSSDHPFLVSTLLELGYSFQLVEDHRAARPLYERGIAVLERTLPPDHPDLLDAKSNLAESLRALGDFDDAERLGRELVEELRRSHSEDDLELLSARLGLASTLASMGELEQARAIDEGVLETSERTLQEDHPFLARARLSLAETLVMSGDLLEARELEELVVRAFERTLPPDHPELLSARLNLASTLSILGDFPAARAIEEEVLSIYRRLYPEDHPQLLHVYQNLASTLARMGEQDRAHELDEKVLAVRERTLPQDHPALLQARSNLAVSLGRLGDHEAARALEASVLASRERTLPADHLDVLDARSRLAATIRMMGELEQAAELEAAVIEVLERLLAPGHPDLLNARAQHVETLGLLGEWDSVRALGGSIGESLLLRIESAASLSFREARQLAEALAQYHSGARFATEPRQGGVPDSLRFELAETLRAISNSPRISLASPSEQDSLREALSAVRARLSAIVGEAVRGEANATELAEEVGRLTRERDRLERSLAGTEPVARRIRPSAVAAALGSDAVAVGFLMDWKWKMDEDRNVSVLDDVYVTAHVVKPDGTFTELVVGTMEDVSLAIFEWRDEIGQPVVARGVAPARTTDGSNASRAGARLREVLLDPVLELVGDAATLFVCADDSLYLVPLDALPLGEGVVGDRIRIHNELSFRRILEPRESSGAVPSLLVVGDPQFGSAGELVAENDRSGPVFARLSGAREEARAVGALFERRFDSEPVVLLSDRATKSAFRGQAPGKRFLHVATHGWFALDSIPTGGTDRSEVAHFWSQRGARGTIANLAPMTVCGLAFAGANVGRGSLGRAAGVLTAEELTGMDLGACELAVLSACETNVGLRRAGLGIQSLRSALHAAGVRTSITSLWKVDDAATRELFQRFYEYLWVEGCAKADALWKAKCDLRTEGHPVRDWAAWVLSGDPD